MKVSFSRQYFDTPSPSPPDPFHAHHACRHYFSAAVPLPSDSFLVQPPPIPVEMHPLLPRLHRIQSDFSLLLASHPDHDDSLDSHSSSTLHPSFSECHISDRVPLLRSISQRQQATGLPEARPDKSGQEELQAHRESLAQHGHATETSVVGNFSDSTKISSFGDRTSCAGERVHPDSVSAAHVKLMCSFGGKIIPRPVDGKLRYVGGETRIITVMRGATLSEFMSNMVQHYGAPLGFKYEVPNEDLDALISVSSDDDFQNMMEEQEKAATARSRIRLFFFSSLKELEIHGSAKMEAEDGRSCLEQEYVKAINGPSNANNYKSTLDSDVGGSVQSNRSANGENCWREGAVNAMTHSNEPSAPSSACLQYNPAIVGDISLQCWKEQLSRVKIDSHCFEGELDRSDGSACSSNASDSVLQHREPIFFIAADTPKGGDHDIPARQSNHIYQRPHHVGDDRNQYLFLGPESPERLDDYGVPVPRFENRQGASHMEPKMACVSPCRIGDINMDTWHYTAQQQKHQQVDKNSWNACAQNRCYGIHKQPQVSNQFHQRQSSNRFMNRSISFHDMGCLNAEQHGKHLFGLRSHLGVPHHPYRNYIGSAPSSPRLGVVDMPGKCSCGTLQHPPVQRCINVDQVCNRWPLEFGEMPMRKNGHGCSASRFCDHASNQLNAQFLQKPVTIAAAEIDHRDKLYNFKATSSRHNQLSEYQPRKNVFHYGHSTHEHDVPSHVSYETSDQCFCSTCLHRIEEQGCYTLQTNTPKMTFSNVPICRGEDVEGVAVGKYDGHDHGVFDVTTGANPPEIGMSQTVRRLIPKVDFYSAHSSREAHLKLPSVEVLESTSSVMNAETAASRRAEGHLVPNHDSCTSKSIRVEDCLISAPALEESVDELWEGFPVTSSINMERFSIAHGKAHLLSPDVIPLDSGASFPVKCEISAASDWSVNTPKVTAVGSPVHSRSSLDSINITAYSNSSSIPSSVQSAKVELNPEIFASDMSVTELLADGMVSFILGSSSNGGFLEENQESDSIVEMDAEKMKDEIGTLRNEDNQDSTLIVSSTSNDWLKVGVENQSEVFVKEDHIVEEENDRVKIAVDTKEIKQPEAEAEAVAFGLQIIRNSDLEDMKELGAGTFGTVYHGKWRGSDVAIKRIRASCFSSEPSQRERLLADFWKEARTLGQLHHPNVVAFYGVVPDGPGGTLATVTEYMVNGSLKQVLQKQDRTIDRRKRLYIAMDAAFGMEYLHSKRIVHFDLKCENLLVNMRDSHRPICKVGDLGLSKIKHQTLVSGGVRGTLPWMAPELLSGDGSRVNEKVDVFSFGIVMWELLTGEEPYGKMHCGAIIAGILNNTLRPTIPNWCDPGWRNLMERCWCGDPAARPSFSEIAKELRAIAASMNVK